MKKATIIILSILAYGCVRLMKSRAKRPTTHNPQPTTEPSDPNQKIRTNSTRTPDDCVRVYASKHSTYIRFATDTGKVLYEKGYRYFHLYKVPDDSLILGEEKVYISLTKSPESHYQKVSLKIHKKRIDFRLFGVAQKRALEEFFDEEIPPLGLLKIVGYNRDPKNGHLDLRIKLFRRGDLNNFMLRKDNSQVFINPRRDGSKGLPTGYLMCRLYDGKCSDIRFQIEDGRQLEKAGYEWYKLSTKRDKTDHRKIKVYILLAKEPTPRAGYLPVYRHKTKHKDGNLVTQTYNLTHGDPVRRIGRVWGKIIEHKQLLKIMDWGIDDRQILSLEIAPV